MGDIATGGAMKTLLFRIGRMRGASSVLQNFILKAFDVCSGVLLICLVDVNTSDPPSPLSSFISSMLDGFGWAIFFLDEEAFVAVTDCRPSQKFRSPSFQDSPMSLTAL